MHEMMVTSFKVDHACDHESSLFKRVTYPPGVICTKHPKEVIYANNALSINKDLYFIFMVRDPRDVMVSSHGSRPGQYYVGAEFYLQALRCAREVEKHPRFIWVRYEDLVSKPDEVQMKLKEKMPFLEVQHKFSDYATHATVSKDALLALNGLRPPDTSSIGRWHKHPERVLEQIKSYPEVVMEIVNLGYEIDNGWLSALLSNKQDVVNMVNAPLRDYPLENNMKLRVFRKSFWYWLAYKFAKS